MIKVYHQIIMADGLGNLLNERRPFQADHTVPFTPENFKLVAIIDIPDEEYGDTFRITNHIEASWCDNPEVRYLESKHVRSTSVGDIIELSNGTKLLCASFGWEVYGKPGKEYQHGGN